MQRYIHRQRMRGQMHPIQRDAVGLLKMRKSISWHDVIPILSTVSGLARFDRSNNTTGDGRVPYISGFKGRSSRNGLVKSWPTNT